MSILKFLIAGTDITGLEYVAKSANDSYFKGICTDGIHVYVVRGQNTIQKFLCSDMSLVLSQFVGSGLSGGITYFNNNVYVTRGGPPNTVEKYLALDLSFIDSFTIADNIPQGINNDGTYLYVSEAGVMI